MSLKATKAKQQQLNLLRQQLYDLSAENLRLRKDVEQTNLALENLSSRLSSENTQLQQQVRNLQRLCKTLETKILPHRKRRKKQRKSEFEVAEDFATGKKGIREVTVCTGRIDFMTSDEIVEVKRAKDWRKGVKQLLTYSAAIKPLVKKKRLYLFDCSSKFDRDAVAAVCDKYQIQVSLDTDRVKTSPYFQKQDALLLSTQT